MVKEEIRVESSWMFTFDMEDGSQAGTWTYIEY